MNILIKNMEIPKKRGTDIILHPNGTVTYMQFDEGDTKPVYVTTEAVALPEHGDLIERDKLIGKASDECGGMSYEDALHVVFRCIENAPTVLEASNGSDN